MNVRKLMTGALLAVGLATIGSAQAQAKLYPGSSCVRYTGPTPALSYSRLLNSGTAYLGLDCPIVHDAAKTVRGGYVDVIDFHDPGAVCAQLVGVSHRGTSFTVRATSSQCTTNAHGGAKRLSFGGLSFDPEAHYYYGVIIPPIYRGEYKSGIISYHANE